MIRRLVILALLPALLSACAAPRRAEFTRLCMGVPTRVVVYAEKADVAREAAAAAFDRIAELEQVMSDYRPDSELMRLCAAADGVPHRVSPDLFRVLEVSQEVARASDGAFDVTIGPLVALWRESRRTHTLPDPRRLSEARSLCGPGLLGLDPAQGTVTLAKPGMRLDLGGIGKGFAAQAAVDLLKARGTGRCLVALAGDVAAGDPPAGRGGWTIDLPAGGSGASRAILLSNAAISTSGDSEQFVVIGGRRYSHIIDPATGLGRTDASAALSVVADRGEIADALATAACVLGPARAGAAVARFKGARLIAPGP